MAYENKQAPEYKVVNLRKSADGISRRLQELATEGWRVVSQSEDTTTITYTLVRG